jgi:hypothetical protein
VALHGADPDQLDELAKRMDIAANELKAIASELTTSLGRSPWAGPRADQFRWDWRSRHHGMLLSSATALHDSASVVHGNAAEQRRASDADGGAIHAILTGAHTGSGRSGGSEHDASGAGEAFEAVSMMLIGAGLETGVVEEYLKHLKPSELEELEGVLGGGFLANVEKASKVIKGASLVTDFLADYVEHGSLPSDERIVHAIADAGLSFAVSEGLDKGGMWIGGAIGSAVPVVGTTGGAILGKLIGAGLSAGFSVANNELGMTDKGADGILAVYRYAKEHDFNPVDMGVDAAGKVAGEAIHAAGSAARTVASGANDAAHAVSDGAHHVAGAVGDAAGGAVSGARDAGSWVGHHIPKPW